MLLKDNNIISSNNVESSTSTNTTLRSVLTPLNSKTSKRKVKQSSASAAQTPNPSSSDSSFAETELVWAKREGHKQYWPGIICQNHNKKMVQDGNKIHVQFFDDPPTKSWIDKRFVKHFNSWKSTSKSHDANWEIGYKAAEKAQALSTKDRLLLITCPISSDDENVNQQSEKSAPKLGRKKSIKAPQPKRRRILFDEHNDPDEDVDGEFCDSQNDGTRNFSHLALDWLKPGKIKDGKGRSPQDLDYDSHTLFVPKEFIQNRTPLMHQWWDMKSKHFDAVLFFKVVNFYDLYHMDALLAAKELGITLMKGNHAHCRFSEGGEPDRFSKYSQLLINRGYRVARVEQTETPEMCNDRVKKTPGATKFDKVIQRELCQITSIGTRTCNFIEGDNWQEENGFLMAIWEKCGTEVSTGSRSVEYGVAFVDTSFGHFHLGQFKDDRYRSRLSTLLTRFRVVEMISARRSISAETLQIFATACPSVLQEKLSPNAECWDTGKTLRALAEKDYFKIDNELDWPLTLKSMFDERGGTLNLIPAEEAELAVKALGALYWYLKECQLDQELFSRRSFQIYRPLDSEEKGFKELTGTHLVLDGMTLRNLDVLSNSSTGKLRGSLYGLLNGCSTPFGQRMMRHWICAPLCQPELIEDRLNAVQFLSSDSNLLKEIERMLKTLPDLERLVNTIHGQGSSLRARNHPDERAIFGPNIQQRKVVTFIQTLAGFRKATRLLSLSRLLDYKRHGSDLLKKSVLRKEQGGEFPDMGPQLDDLVKAFYVPEAVNKGKIIPRPGFNSEYDDALEIIASIEAEAEQYLMNQNSKFRGKVTYVGTENKRFHLEFHRSGDIPTSEEEYTKDGLFLYYTKETNDFQQRFSFAQKLRDNALMENSRRIFELFYQNRPMWEKAIECLSNLDMLSTLAAYANDPDHRMCRPKLIRPSSDQQPFLKMIQGRHPAHSLLFVNNDFISNDVSIGLNDRHSFTLVTGPNMGGKSTLMRQVGLCIILAQMGSFVPCKEFELTPVDRLFTRLGASDRILDGESTFFVELSETAAILQNSTIHSFVLIDEFGRGTSTFDGTAMAYSVIDHLVKQRCRTLFSTHYHSLVKDFMDRPQVKLGHMAYMAEEVGQVEDPSQESIVFLYRFVDGACPKSYGFHAARLAGLPRSIISRGCERARDMEVQVGQMQAFKDLFKGGSSLGKVDWRHIGI